MQEILMRFVIGWAELLVELPPISNETLASCSIVRKKIFLWSSSEKRLNEASKYLQLLNLRIAEPNCVISIDYYLSLGHTYTHVVLSF